MKSFLLFTAMCLVAFYAQAQDSIIKRSGEVIGVKLSEVNPYDIKYKLTGYPDGPVFTVLKEELKEVRYSNGYRESFESYVPPVRIMSPDADLSIRTSGKYFYYKERRIKEPDMLGIVSRLDDKRLNAIVHRTEEIRLFQNITGIAAIPLFVSGAFIYRVNQPRRNRRGGYAYTSYGTQARKNGTILMLCGLGSGILSFSFMLDRRKHDRIVVNAYNATIIKR